MLGSIKVWIGRLALIATGGVFIAAGVLKALDPARFVEQTAAYGILPGPLAAPVAYGLLVYEISLGTALVLDYRRRIAVPAAVVTFVGFIGLMAYTWAAGGDVGSCGCFGNLVERTPAETLIEDLVFLAIALLGLLAPPRVRPGGRARAGAVAAMGAAALVVIPIAPALPLDGLVTALKPGVSLADLKLSLPDPSLKEGRHLVALLDLKAEETGPAAAALNALAGAPGSPSVAAIHADEDEVKDAFFWSHGPSFPMHRVVHEEMRRLYRRLPRYFLLEDGVVKAVWERLPETDTLTASNRGPGEETTR
jgi:uncharacterized membrane protein YphA (DoxX/SURF4 family)